MKAQRVRDAEAGVLDPQGQAVARALGRLGFAEVKDARIGKYIELQLADDVKDVEAHLQADVREAARQHGHRGVPVRDRERQR